MKHLRKFNESWIEDMYNSGRSGGEMPKAGPDGYVDKTTPEDRERHAAFIKSRDEEKEKDSNFNNVSQEFRMAVTNASRADVDAHQKMINLLDEYGVDLIKDRRYLILKRAAELGKEEVMDVLFDALENAGEDTTELKKYLEEYVRASKG
jgi:hypothetical protein